MNGKDGHLKFFDLGALNGLQHLIDLKRKTTKFNQFFVFSIELQMHQLIGKRTGNKLDL
jgi:hypothetical protein